MEKQAGNEKKIVTLETNESMYRCIKHTYMHAHITHIHCHMIGVDHRSTNRPADRKLLF